MNGQDRELERRARSATPAVPILRRPDPGQQVVVIGGMDVRPFLTPGGLEGTVGLVLNFTDLNDTALPGLAILGPHAAVIEAVEALKGGLDSGLAALLAQGSTVETTAAESCPEPGCPHERPHFHRETLDGPELVWTHDAREAGEAALEPQEALLGVAAFDSAAPRQEAQEPTGQDRAELLDLELEEELRHSAELYDATHAAAVPSPRLCLACGHAIPETAALAGECQATVDGIHEVAPAPPSPFDRDPL